MADSTTPRGCSRHLLLIAALFAVAVGIVVARNWDGVGRIVANMGAMREGSAVARALETPDDVLAWIAAHPEHASLVVLDAGGDELVTHEAEAVRPVVGLPSLLLLAEAAERMEAGTLEVSGLEAERLDARRLPGTSEPATPPDVSTAQALVEAAFAGDRAAESELLDRVGTEAVERRARALGVGALEPPVPFEGMLLAWAEGAAEMSHREAVATARRLADRLATSATFREATVQRLREEGFPLGLDEQKAAAAATLPRGTAAGYAELLRLALTDDLGSPAASARVLDVLDATPPDSLGTAFTYLGTRGGGLPGFLALGAVARTPSHPEGRVAVLVLDDLPLAVFYHLVQTRLDTALVLQLLAEADAPVSGGTRAMEPSSGG
jgi:hypothetical protein